MVNINVASFLTSKFNEDAPNIIRSLTDLKYPKIAKYFYINNKKKVSVYTTDSWGNLKVWNKGTCQFELCENMNDKPLFLLTELFQTKTEMPLDDTAETAEITVTSVTTEPNIVELNLPEVKSCSLPSLFESYLPKGYLVNVYTEGEDHYVLTYNDHIFDEPPYWSVLITTKYTIGTIYTNSRSCANKVAQHLNKQSITPSNLNSYFSL